MQRSSRLNAVQLHGRSTSFPLKPLALLVPLVAGLTCAGAHAGPVLPAGGHFVAGGGSIDSGGKSLTINQTSTRGVIDWKSFSIGSGGKVTIDNGTGATLNRVTGRDPSLILGQLNATGSVYVINPQGVVIGPGGVVSTGGRFVASALDVSDSAFMSGGPLNFSGGGNGAVINLGRIGSTGGDVVLVSRSAVLNGGKIDAPNGTVELAAGKDVLLQDASSSQQVFVQTGSKGVVTNAGAIHAAQVSLQAADGNIFALAGNSAAIRATGTAQRDGHVWLVAEQGTVHANGTLVASNADKSGGVVETFGNKLDVGNANVQAGHWKLGADTLTVDGKTAGAIERSLGNGTSVEAQATGASSDLTVRGDIEWKGDAALVLDAGHGVTIDRGATIAHQSGSGDLTLRADMNGVDNGGSVTNAGKIDWSKSTGLVSALYDMNGSYTPGALLSNTQWTPQRYSGAVTQITAYKLVNDTADLQKVSGDLSGNYALGKDVSAGTISPIASDQTPFTGQFDGFGHSVNVDAVSTVISPVCQCVFGGLFAVIGTNGVVRNINVSGSSTNATSTDAALGMLAGENFGTIAYATSGGRVGGSNYNENGGLVGVNLGLIERSSSSADAGDAGNSGGLAVSNYGTIVQSFSTGTVTGYTAGGLVQYNGGVILQSYSTAAVNSASGGVNASSAGSLVNDNGPSGVISESFAAGAVIPAGTVGARTAGIAASNEGKIAANVYWDAQRTQQANGVFTNTGTPVSNANGLTTAQMSQQGSFSGYDFSSGGAWALPAGATHPVLKWQLTGQ